MRNSFLLRLLIFIIFAFLSTAILAEAKLTIHISGITGNALKNTQARLAVAEENSVNDIDEFYHDVPEHIKKALAPYGYFKVNVQTKRSNHSLYFHVEPGPLTKIAHIDLEVTGPGKEDPVIQQFVQHFPLQQGKTLLTEEYEKAKDALFQTALNQGYLKAFLQKKAIEIDLTHDTANIILHLNTGERYYFGRTGFGASPFASEFLNRFVSFKEGEPFSSEKLLQFQNNLSSSGYFKNVIVTPEFENAENNQIPTQVAMTVPKSQQYKIGLGYGTFTGPRLTMGMDWRRIAEQFLSKFENKPRQILAIRDEANKNFESEIQNFIKRLKPANDQLEINPLSLPEYYNKNMNKAWTDTFKQYFKKELNHLTQEFDKIKFDKSEFISEKVKQLCSDFSSKKLLILRDVVTEEKLKQRYGVVLTIFNETYAQLCRDPVFAEIESYFIEYENEIERGHQKERQQQIEQEKKKAEQKPMEVKMEMPVIIPVVKPIINLSRPYSAPVIEEQPKEYKSPPVVVKQNKLESVPRASDDNMSSWKRAVLCGLLSTVIIGLSLTIFGLFLEITLGVALAIVITGVVIGGAEYGVSGYHSQYPGNWPPASTMTIQTQKDNQTRLTVTSANTQDSPQKTLATGSIIKAKGNPWWGFFNHTDSGSKAKANDQLEAKIEKRKIYR